MDVAGRRWFIDTEGSGAQPSALVELGMIETVGLQPTGFIIRWLVRPPTPIDRYATRIHGISDRDVRDCPPVEHIADEILSVIGDVPIAAHSALGDLDILSAALPGWRPSSVLDTQVLSRKLRPDLPRHGLEALGSELGLAQETSARAPGRQHNALYDAMMATLLVERLRQEAPADIFQDACRASESLGRWDDALRTRLRKAERTREQAARHRPIAGKRKPETEIH